MDPGSEPNLRADGIHRERALIKEDFQDAEIGVAQLCPLDAPFRVREQRLKGFHENEPEMHTRRVLPWNCFFSFHFNFILTQIVLMSIYSVSNNRNQHENYYRHRSFPSRIPSISKSTKPL